MIPKHVHEAGLEKAEEALTQCEFNLPAKDVCEAIVSAYLSRITGDEEMIEGVALVLRNVQLPGILNLEDAKSRASWSAVKREAIAALSYLKPDNAREGE